MPEKLIVIESEFFEGADIWTLARVVGADNSTFVQSTADGSPNWSLSVYNLSSSTPTTVVHTASGNASDVLFNSLQPGGDYWSVDEIGYNFRHRLVGSAIPVASSVGGATYKLEFTLNTTLWGAVPIVHYARTRSLQKV